MSQSPLSPLRNGGNTGVRLLRSVAKGDLSTVQALFHKRGKALLHVFGLDGCTPFLLACKKGHVDLARFLVQQGASVADRDKDPKRQGNAIHYACWGGSMEMVRLVLALGASLDDVDIVGNTPLLYAIYGGHLSVVQELLRRGRSLREKNSKNHTAILQAACGGHMELVEWLISRGFSLSETDNDGNTALLFAAWGGHRHVMEYLLRYGASLDEKNHNGHSVFLSAANGGRIDIVEWLLTQGFNIHETNNNGDTALLLAAYGGHLALVQRLLELGASLADRNSCGFTPLLSAANGGQLDMADWLLSHGSSLTERDNDGYSSLILAACGGNIELVKFFLERGASLTERNNNGDSALLLAAYCGHVELVDWLLSNGSSLGERNNTRMGLLVSAANGGHVDVVRLVLERQNFKGLEDTDEGGYTPLLLAAQRGHLEVVQFLAAHGASLRARTLRHQNDARALALDCPEMLDYLNYIWDMTPFQVACDARIVDRVHLALVHGVDPTATRPPALQLCLTQGAYPGAKPPCPETLAVVRLAAQPWSPASHFLHGPCFRRSLMNVFYLEHMVNTRTTLPRLPSEIWQHIASFIPRSWHPEHPGLAHSSSPSVCICSSMAYGSSTAPLVALGPNSSSSSTSSTASHQSCCGMSESAGATATAGVVSGTVAASYLASLTGAWSKASHTFWSSPAASTSLATLSPPSQAHRREWRKRRFGLSQEDAGDAMVVLEEEDTERPEPHHMDSTPMLHASLSGDGKSDTHHGASGTTTAAAAAAAAAASAAVAAHGFRITWV